MSGPHAAHCESCGFDDGWPADICMCVSVPLADSHSDTIDLPLRCFRARQPKNRTVLLSHGASAASRTFLFPRPQSSSSERRDLVGYLQARGYDVWVLDWRGGKRVTEKYEAAYRGKPLETAAFNLDHVARIDLPRAIERIVEVREDHRKHEPIDVIAHCVGAGTLAMSIGSGRLDHLPLGTIVLSTLGLFATVPWDGWAKADDQALERAYFQEPETFAIHPDARAHPWPELLNEAYDVWPPRLLPEGPELFRRISFMFGRPFLSELVPKEISDEDELRRQFGAMALGQYIQLGQWVRRGFAARYETPAPATGAHSHTVTASRGADDDYLNLDAFEKHNLLLISGEYNMLWHADSIRRMYDWLRRRRRGRVEKRIFARYAHQDMFWGENATRDIFPALLDALQWQP